VVGIPIGAGRQVIDDVQGLIQLLRNPQAAFNAIYALATDPRVRAQLGASVLRDIDAKLATFRRALEHGGLGNAEAAGEVIGSVAITLAGAVTGVYGAAATASRLGVRVTTRVARASAARTGPLRTTCSFDGGTFVKTQLGFTQIKDIKAGEDKVWARDTETGAMGYRLVEAHYSNPYDVTVKVSINDVETNKPQTLISNKIHPFFVQLPEGEAVPESSEGHSYSGEITRGAWVDASNLKAGYRLLNDDGSWATVTGVAVESTPLTAYNLTVEGYHTYFVTGDKDASPVWVHNDCPVPQLRGLAQNRPLGQLTDADISSAFNGSGYVVEGHALAQLRNPRLQGLGFYTLNDIRQIFVRGSRYNAGDGAVGISYRGVAVIINPVTNKIITVRPVR
jgi:filamentous hemagglutinin